MRNWSWLVFGGVLLGGCASSVMSEKECLAGDWYGAGFSDGAAGKPVCQSETLSPLVVRASPRRSPGD